ncbi:MAG: class I SAM-dependent methyltransferase [Anaerolineales bacterium]|nr:class I SAM-dependent methyltransferase [Anaerolineales bacterium]
MDTPAVNLTGVARTLLVPLACRALESARPDASLHDPRAEAMFGALGGDRSFLLGMSGHDRYAAVMRVRQFDACARDFLARQLEALVVDLGCGLDTRFYRLDDRRLTWLGVDLPEVIALRRQWLPDEARCRTFAASIFDLTWLTAVEPDQPVLFLAEGVFPYFSVAEVKPLLTALAGRFPGAELVFDALSPLMAWVHNQTSSVLKQSNTRIRWDARDPHELEAWGLRLLDRWGYFDRPEPRLGAAGLIRFIPPLARATYILRYRLGGPAAPCK